MWSSSMRRIVQGISGMVVGVGLALPAEAGLIDLTDKHLYNIEATSLTFGEVTLSAKPDGYLQFTGYGVGVCQSSVGWSCVEVEHPEALEVRFAQPVTLTGVDLGYLQSSTPAADRYGPTYLPVQEIAVIEPDHGFPIFTSGTTFGGSRSVDLWVEGVSSFKFYGFGAVPGFGMVGWHAASLAQIRWTTYTPPSPPPPPPPPPPTPVDPDPPGETCCPPIPPGCCDTIPTPIPVPAPAEVWMVGLGLVGWAGRKIRRRR